MEPSKALGYAPKVQWLLVLQQCQQSEALGKVTSDWVQELSSSDDVSRIHSHQAPYCDQQNPLNWDLEELF